MSLKLLCWSLWLLALCPALPAAAEPTQVIIVRHAERAAEPRDDPALSPEGKERAALLAELLAAADVRTILTTPYRRTRETAAALAQRLGIEPTVIATRPVDNTAHIAAVAAQARQASGAVLVVGHSNTVAGIVAALSGSQPMPLCDTSYSNLFIVTPAAPLLPAIQLKFGRPDPAGTAHCQ
ncbi:SixA phosphatase family protein [Paucibacter soli]|uniref:SixA phosphatase family protein n=1 Tax=Paucibacter soli TaxID=3133433 RepID=UPI0030B25D15